MILAFINSYSVLLAMSVLILEEVTVLGFLIVPKMYAIVILRAPERVAHVRFYNMSRLNRTDTPANAALNRDSGATGTEPLRAGNSC